MGSKNKLKRFIENESFHNVIQPSRDELINHSFKFLGKWNEFLHGYTLGLLQGMSITPIFSNHDVYKNLNAPDEVVKIQTHYENIYLKEAKKISYLSFRFNE